MTDSTPDWYARWERAIRSYSVECDQPLSTISVRAGLAKSYLSNTLNKKRVPRVDDFLAICDAVNVSAVQILLGLPWSDETREIVEHFLSLDRRQRVAFVQYAKTWSDRD